MSTNRVVYIGPGKVEVQGIHHPKFVAPNGKEIDHGVILGIVSTNIGGSDQHMVRGRPTAPAGLVLGHEITGEVIEKGHGAEYFEIGDLVGKTNLFTRVLPRPFARLPIRRYASYSSSMESIRTVLANHRRPMGWC
jgi:NADPH:quinone reductase-like Zn-dependent oxidoreductase